MRRKTKYNPKVVRLKRPKKFSFEKRDCTVRSLKSATGMTYSNAHKMMSRFGYRKNKYGARFPLFLDICKIYDIFTEEDECCTMISKKMFNGLTLNKLFQEPAFLNRKWIVKVRRHVFFVDNGVVYGLHGIKRRSKSEGSRRKVQEVFEIINKKTITSKIVNKYLET